MNLFNMLTSLKDSRTKTKIYRCCDCRNKYQNISILYKHILTEHKDNIPEGQPVEQYYFNRRRGIVEGPLCVICKKNRTKWNPKICKYYRFCSDECKKKAVELFRENYKKKYGKDHSIDDPEYQEKLQKGRRISGTYKFLKGGEITYGSSYESHFLEYCDRVLGIGYKDIERCPFIFYYMYSEDGSEEKMKQHFYMPDFYIPVYNLIIEIKDGGDNPNKHPKIQSVDKTKEKLKDKAIIESQSHNYIKVVNKDYEDFNHLLEILKSEEFNENSERKFIIHIPETEYQMTTLNFINQINKANI